MVEDLRIEPILYDDTRRLPSGNFPRISEDRPSEWRWRVWSDGVFVGRLDRDDVMLQLRQTGIVLQKDITQEMSVTFSLRGM